MPFRSFKLHYSILHADDFGCTLSIQVSIHKEMQCPMSKKGLSVSVVIGAAVLIAALLFAGQSSFSQKAPPPGDFRTILADSWNFYKQNFMVNDERVESNNFKGTITEGQSYALMKSVWMDDQATFKKVWNWTKANMRRPGDNLFGWHWGQTESGQWGLIHTECAPDGDQDIAYALLLAGEKWNIPAYTAEAKAIIRDLWRLQVVEINGRYYLSGGDWPPSREGYLTVNPSYMAPYVYRKFAKYDKENASGWMALAQNVYPTLEACSALHPMKLPPNWCGIRYEDNRVIPSTPFGSDYSSAFSYDAVRVFWRMAADARLGSINAKSYLQKHRALIDYWNKHHTLPDGFDGKGMPLGDKPSGFALSMALAQNHVLYPESDRAFYDYTLAKDYRPDGYWYNGYNDFLHSVIWFGLYTASHPPSEAGYTLPK